MVTTAKKLAPKPIRSPHKHVPVAKRFKASKALLRGGNRLRVAKPLSGDDAVEVLRAAGILTANGKLSPSFS